jgi:hypothetical protein
MTENGSAEPAFTVAVDNNPYRSPADRELHAIITVTASGLAQARADVTPQAVEVILVDCSDSMNRPPDKLLAARRATKGAIDTLRDGVLFAVVGGTAEARMIYPEKEALAVAGPGTRSAAAAAVNRLRASGGTAMGRWLTLANRLMSEYPNAIRHALLFTDGKNEHETPGQLGDVLAACAGRFACDARGIGVDWEPAEVLRIVSALDGQADAVRTLAELEGELRAIMDQAMRKQISQVGLQLRVMTGTRLGYLKQSYPARVDLTDRLRNVGEVSEVNTGSWGDEHREYHLCLDIDSTDRPIGEDLVAARVRITAPDLNLGDLPWSKVMLHWSEDAHLTLQVDPHVGAVTGQAEMGTAIEAGCAALGRAEDDVAEQQFGLAVRLAHASGDEESLRRLARLVDIEDAEHGVVRLKSGYSPEDILPVSIRSIMSDFGQVDPDGLARAPVSTPVSAPAPAEPAGSFAEPSGPGPVCPDCGFVGPPGARGCEQCGRDLSDLP